MQEKCEQSLERICQKREQENKPIKDPKKFRLPLDEDNEGRGFCKMKLPTYGEEKTVVEQWDSAGERLPKDFALTTNSTIHCQFLIKGYKNGSQQGLTLKLTDIQVIELAEPMERPSPFEAEEGGFKASDADLMGILQKPMMMRSLSLRLIRVKIRSLIIRMTSLMIKYPSKITKK